MAVLQNINSEPTPCDRNDIASQTTWRDLRINRGVIAMRRAPSDVGWRLISAAVRRYRTLSPESRAALHVVAVCLVAILVRLIIGAEE
jgi:hypothetical protein